MTAIVEPAGTEEAYVHSGRSVVTGIGAVAPNGIGVEEFWAAILRGQLGIARLTRFSAEPYSSVLAGEIKGFEASAYLPSRLLPQTDHVTRLSLVAAAEALRDSAADPKELPEFAAGVVTASSAGGFEFGQRELEALWSKGGAHVSAYQSFAWFYAVNTGQISIKHGMRGSSSVLVSDQAGGIDAVAKARRRIRADTPFMLTGAVDGSLCPWGWVCLSASGTLSTATEPERGFLPFDTRANGSVIGEGGALLVVEDERFAHDRGAPRIYGEIAGYGSTFDPRASSGREPGLRRAAEIALADSGLTAADIDVVFADGAGAVALDAIESAAIAAIFGARGVPVTVPKTMTGRLLAGGASLDLAMALLSVRDGVIPPTVGISSPAASESIDLVSTARHQPVRSALVLARGQGGFNSAMVVRRFERRR